MCGVWSRGSGPGSRGDRAKRKTTIGTWRALNTRLENLSSILAAANLNLRPKKDSTGLETAGRCPFWEASKFSPNKRSPHCPLGIGVELTGSGKGVRGGWVTVWKH